VKTLKIILGVLGVGGWAAFGVVLYLYLDCGGINIVIPDGPTSDTSWSVDPVTKCEKNPLILGDGTMEKDIFTVPCGDGCKKAERRYKIVNKNIFYHNAIEFGYAPVFLFSEKIWVHNIDAMYWYQWPRFALGAGVDMMYVSRPLKADFGIGPKIGARYSW
jgi:hypothetical protein